MTGSATDLTPTEELTPVGGAFGAHPFGAENPAHDRTAPGPVPVIELRQVEKVYATGSVEVEALRGVSLNIDRGEYVAVMGPSGSGKSTLMHIVGCLDVPTGGPYLLAGEDVGDDVRGRARRRPQPADRVRVPAVQPVAVADGAGATSSCR